MIELYVISFKVESKHTRERRQQNYLSKYVNSENPLIILEDEKQKRCVEPLFFVNFVPCQHFYKEIVSGRL